MNKKEVLGLVAGAVFLVLLGLAIYTFKPIPTETPIRQMKIGDYVQFGVYAEKPILWRVIEDSANPNASVGDVITGDPLLFSDKVICIKPFDAAGPHDDDNRLKHGSNLWQTSNMRSWLNSHAEAGDVIWACGNPPTNDSVDSNDYAGEKGFLADGNFIEYERNLIKHVTQKALLYYEDWKLAEGGSEYYNYGGHIDTIVANYYSAWYHNVTDKVFFLDPIQVNRLYNRFGSYYNNGLDDYWLRAPDSDKYVDSSSANVLYIRVGDGHVMYKEANFGNIGVRPALTLNHESVVFESGNGSRVNPFVTAGQ